MRIVFMGTPEIAAITLERLLTGPDRLVGVVTQPERASGRGQKKIASPVARVAEKYQIPLVAPQKIRAPNFLATLQNWRPELIVVVAYGRILPPSILELAPRGCLNVHYSLLPKYRGAAPVAWAIANGEEKSGVTTMRLVEQMDAGPIYLQEELALADDETTGSLQVKLAPLGARLLRKTIEGLKNGSIVPKSQTEQGVSYAPMLKKEDGLIDWTLPAAAIERRVRAFNPWPSAYSFLQGKLIKIHRARVVATEASGQPGEVVKAEKSGLCVATGSGALSLEEVQLENRKRLPAAEFLKGTRIATGECFTSA